MKKINLRERVGIYARAEPSRIAVVTPSGALSFGELAVPSASFPGRNVAIVASSLLFAISGLVSNDGKARSLALFPAGMAANEIEIFLGQLDFDVFLSDSTEVASDFVKSEVLDAVGLDSIRSDKELENLEVETQWLIPTSGTTSTPKLVRHTATSLARAGRSSSESGDDNEVWGLLYDPARFAGLQVVFQSVFSGKTLVVPPEGVSLEERVAFLAEHEVTHISATPTLWRKILMVPGSSLLPLRKITLGGEASDQLILSALRSRYPQARITHVYASTEAGVGFWVSDDKAGFPAHFLVNNPGKPELEIRDGYLWVRSQGAASGYVNRELVTDDGWVNTGDIAEVRGDRFFILGRGGQTVNVGGDKVMTEQVRLALLECEAVADAYVFGRSNPITGTIVAAEVVLSEGQSRESARERIDEFLRNRLRETERPRVIRFVEEISVSSTGKAMAKGG